ncbi:alkane oxidation protein activator PraB [Pseudomonas sp. K2I15]|uniref:alkane oxidation protein activator PraB n=1 Tax=unclassified Pseudomonas TaxID=196821 RepID=UPI000B4CC3F2|nr:alkane oxidation protein activator PraB [Pseudomonas sp. K2I15]OWP69673.1 protein activator of alkane oxidation PraB [Pseudomonas sp. K2I15]
MKSLKTLVSLTALTVCMGAASMANAFSLSPINSNFTAPGTISVKSPSSLQLPITCNVTFTGTINGSGVASINGAAVSGSNSLCSLPQITGLPWILTATGSAGGSVTNVGYNITASGVIPSHCGPSTITVGYNNTSQVLTATNQALAGSCTVQSLSVTVANVPASGPVVPVVIVP